MSVIKSRRIRRTGHEARVGDRCIQILVGKPDGKTQLVRPRRRWEDNIKMDIQTVECGGTDWIDLAQDTES